MANLQGVPPIDFWRDLIHTNNSNSGVPSSLTALRSGNGNTFPIEVSTTTINFTNVVTHEGRGLASSSGTTGGSGSAGSGNQYIELTVGGSTYKVLHDGTV
jgi:hypothetical protein